MLLKRPQDLARVREKVLKAHWDSVKQLKRDLGHRIKEFNFQPRNLVLVRNSRFDKGLTNKTKPLFLGPMVVIWKTKGGSYILGKLDSALSKLRFAAFRLIPYLSRDIHSVPITRLTDIPQEELEELTHDSGNMLDVDFDTVDNIWNNTTYEQIKLYQYSRPYKRNQDWNVLLRFFSRFLSFPNTSSFRRPQDIQRWQGIFEVGHGIVSGLRTLRQGSTIITHDVRIDVMTSGVDDRNYIHRKPLVKMRNSLLSC